MRLFIGIHFDINTKEKIAQIMKSLPIEGADKAQQDNLHLTLKFLGETESKRVESIKEAINEASFGCTPFEISTNEIGSFSSKGEYTVWLGIEENKRLNHLYDELENQLKKIGIEKEKRAFLPHITLLRRAKKQIDRQEKPIKIAVDGITLFESKKTDNGLLYIPIHFAEFPNK